jgi:hypothetical protein
MDTRTIPEHLISDPTFQPRLTWRTSPRFLLPGPEFAKTIAAAGDHSYFCDSSFVDDNRHPAIFEALLEAPARLYLTPQVRAELEPWLAKRPGHPLAKALSHEDDAILTPEQFAVGAKGRRAFDYYTALLSARRRVLVAVRDMMSEENGTPAEQQDEQQVLDRLQREFGDRGRMLATKSAGPLHTDEVLVYLAFEHALRTGNPTIILSNDGDIEEQFLKLLWLLNGHYRAMLCARVYASDFGAFRTIPIASGSTGVRRAGIEREGAILIDGDWGPGLERVLPQSCRFVPISYLNGGTRVTQMTFGGEQEMAEILDVKDRTGGRSTDLLGTRNLHASFPDELVPAGDRGSYVLLAWDRCVEVPNSGVRVASIDMVQTVFNKELPRTVEMVPRQRRSPVQVDRRRFA